MDEPASQAPVSDVPASAPSVVSPASIMPPKSGHKALIGTVVAVLVLVGAYAAYAKYTDMWPFAPTAQPILSTSPSPSASTDPTAGWQTYTSAQYGFELKYPPTLTKEGPGLFDWKNSSGQSALGITVRTEVDGKLLTSQEQSSLLNNWFDSAPVGPITLSGRSGNKFVYRYCDGPGCGAYTIAFVVPYKTGVLALEFLGDQVMDATESQILSSFKFTTSDATANWKAYVNTQYGFSLTFTDLWAEYSITQQQLAGDTPHVDLGFSVNDLGTKYTGFWISVYSKANWQKRLEQGGQSGMVIGQNGTYVFVATYPQAPPGDPKLKNLNNPSVLSTFRLTN